MTEDRRLRFWISDFGLIRWKKFRNQKSKIEGLDTEYSGRKVYGFRCSAFGIWGKIAYGRTFKIDKIQQFGIRQSSIVIPEGLVFNAFGVRRLAFEISLIVVYV